MKIHSQSLWIQINQLTVNFIRIIYPPLSFIGEKNLNRSLSQAEYINVLTWQANPNNEDIVKYRIYILNGTQEEKKQNDGIKLKSLALFNIRQKNSKVLNGQSLLVELDASTLKYWHRGVEKDRSYNYAVVAVNSNGREGTPASYLVQ